MCENEIYNEKQMWLLDFTLIACSRDIYFAIFFYFLVIGEILNSRMNVHVFFTVYRDSLSARI